jgi:crotonobetainyl-CoA:carnitine CoA-transferase CaiB-like acyl-CoA transferase
MSGPLDGVTVVEIGAWVAGPAAGGILADWGAEVIKVEPPSGDPARTFRQILGGDLPSNPVFELDNRSKSSIVVDSRADGGLALIEELIAGADVFLTNLRPAALKRWGLDHETLCERHPSLVYALLTGYGLDGPDADKPAYDIAAYWARSGIAAALRPPGGALPFQRGGMGDHTVAMTAAAMVSAALVSRERTGKGQFVSTSLLRQGAYTVGFDVNVALMWGLPVSIGKRETMRSPVLNNYQAGDGRWFWIVGLEGERHWPPLARAVGHPEWISDPRYATPAERAKNCPDLIVELDQIFATKSLDEWAEIFATEPDFFWSPVNTINDLVADEQFAASGGLTEVPGPDGNTTMLATPVDFHGTPWQARAHAPRLGEHTEHVLRRLGRTDDQIAQLVSDGVVRLLASEEE